MRIARWVAAIVGGLVLLALIGVVAVTMFVDPNRFRGQIEAAVTRETGQPFDIEGDLSISWFPWLALRTGPSQFGRTSGPDEEPILQWKAARVGARLVPLLKGQLEIDTIRLEEPRIHLVRHADGSTNWDALLDALRNRSPEPTPAANKGPGPQIGGFQLRDGSLVYTDERPDSARTVSLSDWRLDIGEWHAGTTFPVETELTLDAGDGTRAQDLQLSARLHFSDDMNDIDLFGLELGTRVFAAPLPKSGMPIELEISRMALRRSPLDISISELSSRIWNVRLTSSIQAGQAGEGEALYVRGPLEVQVPSVRDLVGTLELDAPLPLDDSTLGRMNLSSMLEWKAGAISANAIQIDLDETHLSGEMERTAGETPVWTFALHGDKIGLSRYIELEDKSDEPFELPVKALKALQARGELTFEQAWLGEAQMRGVKLRLELEDGKLHAGGP